MKPFQITEETLKEHKRLSHEDVGQWGVLVDGVVEVRETKTHVETLIKVIDFKKGAYHEA